MTEAVWYVYLLECATGRIYTGVSPRPKDRIEAHREGRGALFTRINQPQRLLAVKPFPGKRQALQVEAQIKRMPAAGKRHLAQLWSGERVVLALPKAGVS
jgi:putative endonuclease